MMKISRSDCPDWLVENGERWANQWNAKRENPNKRNDWNWYIYQKVPINQLLLPILIFDTTHHCSYCDKRPIGVETIDHFKPKSVFPLDSYTWDNLFVSCYDCQVSRLENYQDLLLKPDELSYEFETFYYYDDDSGKLFPNGSEDSEEFIRANFTIKAFKLNERGLPEARKLISKHKTAFQDYNLEKLPFRFIFTR